MHCVRCAGLSIFLAAFLRVANMNTALPATNTDTAGEHRSGSRGKLIAVLIVCAALGMAVYAALVSWHRPSTSDASINADVVHVAANVGGSIIDIAVQEDSYVKKGDLLFQIDPRPYQLAVDQSQADLEVAQAQLDTSRKSVSTQRSQAAIARDQAITARANYELATRTADRIKPLTAKGYVTNQQGDQADVSAKEAATQLQQARVQEAAALQAVETVQAAESTVAEKAAALRIAARLTAARSVETHAASPIMTFRIRS